MANLSAGYFTTTYFPSCYWQTNYQYWTEYTAPAPTQGNKYVGRAVLKRKLTDRQLEAIRRFFEALR